MARPYPLEVKAAVLADIAAGNAIAWVAEKHGVSRTAALRWRDQAGLSPMVAGATEKKVELGRKLLDLTAESIDTMGFLLRSVRDPSWFQQQPAVEIATLLGVISDKTVRLLQAMQPIEDSSGTEALTEGVYPAGVADS